MSGKGAGVSVLPELFRLNLYKPNQGRRVRQATFVALLLIAALGMFSLSVHMGDETTSDMVRVGVPVLGWAALAWIAFRAVNVPRFADFMISVDAELTKVVWPSWKEVVQATIVVLATMAFFGVFLFGVDQIWQIVFRLVHFVEYL